jgi:hypothetical protein
VTNNIRYAYVSGSPDAIRRSWSQFEQTLHRDDAGDSVQFIPAMGGCFIVAKSDEPLALALLPSPLRPSRRGCVSMAQLQAFKNAFEGHGPYS